eukprot:SM000180S03529  [mRNA]  locus=s180:117262:124424:- [translate_table: standard]
MASAVASLNLAVGAGLLAVLASAGYIRLRRRRPARGRTDQVQLLADGPPRQVDAMEAKPVAELRKLCAEDGTSGRAGVKSRQPDRGIEATLTVACPEAADVRSGSGAEVASAALLWNDDGYLEDLHDSTSAESRKPGSVFVRPAAAYPLLAYIVGSIIRDQGEGGSDNVHGLKKVDSAGSGHGDSRRCRQMEQVQEAGEVVPVQCGVDSGEALERHARLWCRGSCANVLATLQPQWMLRPASSLQQDALLEIENDANCKTARDRLLQHHPLIAATNCSLRAGAMRAAHRKGIGSIFPNRDEAADGDVSESRDAGGSPGKSSLFFSTYEDSQMRMPEAQLPPEARMLAALSSSSSYYYRVFECDPGLPVIMFDGMEFHNAGREEPRHQMAFRKYNLQIVHTVEEILDNNTDANEGRRLLTKASTSPSASSTERMTCTPGRYNDNQLLLADWSNQGPCSAHSLLAFSAAEIVATRLDAKPSGPSRIPSLEPSHALELGAGPQKLPAHSKEARRRPASAAAAAVRDAASEVALHIVVAAVAAAAWLRRRAAQPRRLSGLAEGVVKV